MKRPPESSTTPDPTLFGTEVKGGPALFEDALVAAYVAAGRTLDDLAYTEEFESIYLAVGGEKSGKSRWEVLHRLQNIRKAKRLPRLGKAVSPAIKVTQDEEALLVSQVQRALESKGCSPALGQRDQLLYDPRFADIVTTFNAKTGRSLTPHDVWRLVAKLAK